MLIRNARLSDAAAMAQIYAPYVSNTAISFEYEPPTAEEFLRRIEAVTNFYPWLIAETDEGDLAGYCYARSFSPRAAFRFDAELAIYIRQDLRQKGYGTALYAALEDCLQAQNVLNLYACIVVPGNGNAQHVTKASFIFHEGHGYTLAGRFPRSGYKFGEWYDIVYMGKTINPLPDQPAPLIPYRETALYAQLNR